jgi:4-amino-4-deoxy-L-arabinose transferase-like glycosyltransferase
MPVQNYVLLAVVVWLMVIGMFIRIWGLWNYAFSPDEVMLASVPIGDSLHEIWSALRGQTNPPLMYGILYGLIKISTYELVLRCMSLLSGTASILVFFLLGRRVSGTASGIAMAYLAAFSSAAIQMSQVVRPYSILLLFLSLALWCFISYAITCRQKYLYGYSLFMLLSTASHYSAVICFAAIGIVWFSRLIIQKESVNKFYKIAFAHVPSLVMLIMLYIYHVSFQAGGEGIYTQMKQTYLAPLFPHTLSGLIQNTASLFRYLFFPVTAKWLMVIAGAGFLSLWKSQQRYLATTVLIAFLLTFVLTYLNVHPFGGSRQSIYLLPLIALLIGAAVQTGCDILYHRAIPFLNKRICFLGKNLQSQLYVCIACLVASTLIITFYFKQHAFLRQCGAFNEFPLKQESYAKLNRYLKENMQHKDIIITNGESSNYFKYDEYIETNHKPQIHFLAWYCRKIVWNEFDCFYVFRWNFEKMEIVLNILKAIHQHVDFKKNSKVWLVNIGWDAHEIGTFLSAEPSYIPYIRKELSVEGGSIYSVKADNIIQSLLVKKKL